MKFIISWSLSPATYNETISRFLQTGGLPPAGVKMIGRWHGTSGKGFALAETTDAKAIYAWMAMWADLLSLEVTPCLDDAEAAVVLQGLKK